MFNWLRKFWLKNQPCWEKEPKPGDKFRVTVAVYNSGELLYTLHQSFHPTKIEAQTRGKNLLRIIRRKHDLHHSEDYIAWNASPARRTAKLKLVSSEINPYAPI